MCWKTHPCSGACAVFLGAGVKSTRALRTQELLLTTHCGSWFRELVFTYASAYSNRIPWIAVGEEQRTWGYLKGHLPWLTVVHDQLLSAWRQIPFVTGCSPLLCSESEYFLIFSSLYLLFSINKTPSLLQPSQSFYCFPTGIPKFLTNHDLAWYRDTRFKPANWHME